jgi:sugar lactone lactonase YvrE
MGPATAAAHHLAGRAARPAAAATISTVAGGPGGPDPGTNVSLIGPCGVSYRGGQVYVADTLSVKRLSPSTGRLSTEAGTGSEGPAGDGGPALSAGIDGTCGAAVDSRGNLIILDNGNHQLQVIAHRTGWFYQQHMTAGDVYDVAGGGQGSHLGNGGLATRARLTFPNSVTADSAGNLVIADTGEDELQVIAEHTGIYYGQAMTTGHIYAVAGDGKAGYTGDGSLATRAELDDPSSVAIDVAGNLVIADKVNDVVRVVAEHTGIYYGQAMTSGDIYAIAGSGTRGYSGDGGPATSAELNWPQGLTLDAAGNLVIADTGNERVRVVAEHTGVYYGQAMTSGDIYTIAGTGVHGYTGNGGPALKAKFYAPGSVAIDSAGSVVISDDYNGRVRVVAERTGTYYGQAMTAGDVYTVAGNGQDSFSGNGAPAVAAELLVPTGVAEDAAGNLVIADTVNYRIRMIAGRTGTFFGQAMKAGNIYTIAGDGQPGYTRPPGGSALRAELAFPWDLVIDAAGNVLIADTGVNVVQVIAAGTGTFYGQAMTTGHIYTLAGNGSPGYAGDGGPSTKASLAHPGGVALDAAGNVLIADTGNNVIRVIAAGTGVFYGRAMTAGDIYTVAGTGSYGYTGDGGPATTAELAAPTGVTADNAGNLVIADGGNNVIRVIAASTGVFYGRAMTAGDIYTVAGDGNEGYSGDGGAATAAELNNPQYVAVDRAGNLVLSDFGNNRIRVVAGPTGTFYGVPMTAGDIYTVAGDGNGGFSGDGGPATGAELDQPAGVAVNSAGDLLIADTLNGRIREVPG